jgi:hypothetical protein
MSVRIDQNAESGAEAAAPTPERWAAISTAVGPVLLLAAFLWHPPIPGRLPDDAAVAEAAAADLTRWGFAHFAAVLSSAAIAVAFVAVREYLRAPGTTAGVPSTSTLSPLSASRRCRVPLRSVTSRSPLPGRNAIAQGSSKWSTSSTANGQPWSPSPVAGPRSPEEAVRL